MDCYRRKRTLPLFSGNKELKSYKAPYHIAGDDVSAICEDAHGQIFVGTLTKGLFRLSSRQEGNFEPVLYQNRMNLNIRTLIIDTRGKLIIGTDGEGVKNISLNKILLWTVRLMRVPLTSPNPRFTR